MDSHQIVITRDTSFIGCAVSYNVELDGIYVGVLKNGGTISVPSSSGTHRLSFIAKGKIEEMVSILVEENQPEVHISAKFNSVMKLRASGNHVEKIEFENNPRINENEKVLNSKKKASRDGNEKALIAKNIKFVAGLNLPQGVLCDVSCFSTEISISVNRQEFVLSANKLIDVSIMTNTEIQKQYVSSVGGAVAGAILLGPIGAVLGGSASKKSIKTNTKYLIFTYEDGSDQKYIAFDATDKISSAKKIESKFWYLKNNESVKIEL